MSLSTPTPRRSTAKRIVLAVELFLLLAVLAALAITLWLRHTMRANLPQLDGEAHIPGLTAPVTITRDAHSVPSIHAANLDDLLFVQGYLTATDRLWQMDALRRHGAGELAAILGPSLIDHDRQQRYLQMRAAADRSIAVLPADQLHQLIAYANGVNAYIATHADSLPVEFHALHYNPAPWLPRDTLLIALVMSQDLTTSFPTKLNREALAAHLPANLLADMYPVGSWRDHPPMQPPVDLTAPVDVPEVPLDETQSSLQAPTATPHDLLTTNTALGAPFIGSFIADERVSACPDCTPGSNNWAVAASRSTTGAPLLSDDMHLALSAPGIWYEAALHTSDHSLDVEGFTLPGVPFIIVGRNQHVAWGFTNTGADVQDLYIEHLRGSGNQTEFQHPDTTWSPVTHNPEHIIVRGGRDITLDVLTTTHTVGSTTIQTPILSPLYKSERRSLSLAWNVYDPATITAPFLAINSAPDAASLVAAFSTFGSPSQNLIYADAQHIGYHALGRIPIRGSLDKRPHPLPPLIAAPDADTALTPTPIKPTPEQKPAAPLIDYTIGSPLANTPVDALDPTHQWAGYIPYDALPAILDPPAGVLATANARITPDNYPYTLTDNWADPYRVERIRHLLDNRTKLTPSDMLHIQTDLHSEVDLLIAQRLAYAVDHTTLHANADRLHQAANLLRAWDGDVRGDLTPDADAAASITIAARSELWPMLLTAKFRAQGITDEKQLADLTAIYTWGEKNTALETLIAHQPKRWLPTGFATWNDLLTAAVDRALRQAPANLATWSYGSYHPVEIAHPVFGSQSLLSRLLGTRTGTGTQPLGGDATTVHAAGLHFGPSERFTADLANPDHTFANITTGQSGNPASPFYLDQFPAWQAGTTLPMPLNRPTITHTLTLLP